MIIFFSFSIVMFISYNFNDKELIAYYELPLLNSAISSIVFFKFFIYFLDKLFSESIIFFKINFMFFFEKGIKLIKIIVT
jgi:hypothetical protein